MFNALFSVQSGIVLLLGLVALVAEVFALVDAVRHRPDAFVAAGKRTKQFWTIVLVVAALLGFVSLRNASALFSVGTDRRRRRGHLPRRRASRAAPGERPGRLPAHGTVRTVVTGDHAVTGDQAAERDRSADVADLPDPRDDIFMVQRPWGNFQQFVSNERVTVKIITVDPGHRLSLQTHDHRGEFWQVLDVPIEVTVGDRTWSCRPGRGGLGAVPRGAPDGQQG